MSVSEDAAIRMAEHLHEQGRIGPIGPQTAQLMSHKLGQAVALSWGVRAKRFEDSGGGGWICDVSSAYEGELMYAVVRSQAGGSRIVTECVEETVAVALAGGQERPDTPRTREAPAGGGQAEAAPRGPFKPPAQAKPDDPRLIVYWEPVEGDEPGPVNVVQTTYSEAQSKVLPLLMRGCKVEVWSGKKTPTIKVDL